MSEVTYNSVRPLQVDQSLATRLQNIGYEAWADAYGGEWSSEDIRQRFETRNPAAVENVIREYQIASQLGGLSIVTTPNSQGDHVPVGFAIAHNELARDPFERLKDRIKHPLKHAHVQLVELNVLPEFQNQGIGRELIAHSLKYINKTKIPTAWVPEEGLAIRGLLGSLGFAPSPDAPEPAKRQGLGPLGPMSSYHYLVSPSVDSLRKAIDNRR